VIPQNKEGGARKPDFDIDLIISGNLPVYYNLRDTKRLSPVKTQPNGGCWASAAMGSVESVWRTLGYGNDMFSDINLKMFHGFVAERSSNGNHHMATAYFTRGSGPLLKNSVNDSIYQTVPVITKYNTDACFLPNDPDLIKQEIMDFGAVYSMMYFRKNDLDTISFIYYTSTKKINHAVILTGWNDTLRTKKGIGVWIAQNSLGATWGDNGFFYIPYDDPNILDYNAIWKGWIPFDPDLKIYYYDTLGSYHSYGFGDTICYGMVKFSAGKDLHIAKIGTHINHPGTVIHAEIYTGFDTATKLLSDLRITTNAVTCRFSGYYTINLDDPVKIKKGQDFFVVMKYTHPSDTVPLPVECYIKGYSNPHITEEKCWVNPNYLKWRTTWYECGSKSKFRALNFDLCIRAYCLEED
jgi:hypothetical protein